MGQRHHLMRQTAVLGRVAAAVRAEAALEHVHVPQISADLLAHLDAVTRVELAADDGVVLQAEVLLRHVGVALEAARRDDHAAQRAHVAGLAVARDLHADHDAAVRILNQLDGRGLEPHVDLVRALDDRVLHRLIQEAVAHALMGGAQRRPCRCPQIPDIPAHLADDRHARPIHELGIVAVEELILELIPHVGHASTMTLSMASGTARPPASWV